MVILDFGIVADLVATGGQERSMGEGEGAWGTAAYMATRTGKRRVLSR